MIPFRVCNKVKELHDYVTVLYKTNNGFFVYFHTDKCFGFLSEKDLIDNYEFVKIISGEVLNYV